MTYQVSVVDPRTLTDEQITEFVELSNLLVAERLPDDPPTPPEVWIAAVRGLLDHHGVWYVLTHASDGRLVCGSIVFKDFAHDDNPEIVGVTIEVHPEHRGRGVATAQLAQHVALARQLGRSRFIGGSSDDLPSGAAFATSLGAQVKSRLHLNRLLIEDVDRDLLLRWVDEQSPDYELVRIDGPVPEELLPAYLDVVQVMNTAPRDDLKVNDYHLTATEVRDDEERSAALGTERWLLLARRRSSGEIVGLHDVDWSSWRASHVMVGVTGVLPSHRGHGLGKWLKAAMTLRVLAERPRVTEIRTGNADSNAAMLAINQAMGYRPFKGTATWEVSVQQVQDWLAARNIDVNPVQLSDAQSRPPAAR